MTRVSVIMVTGGSRLVALENVLNSWSRITHPDFDFSLTYSGKDEEFEPVKDMASKYSYITKFEKSDGESTFARTTQIWRKEGMASVGDYVVFAMSDEILGDYHLLEMMEYVQDQRSSVATYFLNAAQTGALSGINWLDDPRIIEQLPEFWTHTEFEGAPNTTRGGAVVCHINGATRKYWDYLGWHRGDEFGYLNLDQDIIIRENFLGFHEVDVSLCYHQWHGPGNAYVPDAHRLAPYLIKTEAQARLLEPSERWKDANGK